MIDRYNLYFMASSSNVLLPLPFSVDGRMDAALVVMVGNKTAYAMIPTSSRHKQRRKYDTRTGNI